MNTKKFTLRNLICSIAAFAVLVLANIGLLNISKPTKNVYAADGYTTVTISNPNFNGNTSSTYPFKPNSYSIYKNGQSSSGDSSIKSGVINLSDEDYSTKFANAKENRVGLDDYVLMLESKTTSFGYYGYRTDSAVTMNADSNYMITVDVYTYTNAGIASLALYNEDGSEFSSIKKISSHNTWTTYHFFVTTNETPLKLKLGMNITDSGVVLFDNISAYQISDNLLTARKNSLDSSKYSYTNKVDNVIKNYIVNNSVQFKDTLNPSNYTDVNFVKGDISSNTQITNVVDKDGTNTNAILINNLEKTYSEYETNDFLTFEQNMLYKVTISAKAANLSGTAKLTLLSSDKNLTETASLDISSSTTNAVTNGYNNYSFYVKSAPLSDSNYKLSFALGSSESTAKGMLYISNITVSKINHDTYKAASSNSQLDLSKGHVYSSNSIYLDNANFNAIEISNYNQPLPATPTSWTVSTGSGIQHYGVVNTKDSSFATLSNLNMTSLSNPYGSENINNNVLMMYNESKDVLSYKSTEKTSLAANSYHRFEIKVQTQNAPLKLSLVSSKDGADIELSSITVETGKTNWQVVTMYLKTGYQSINVALRATLETEGFGYAYLDDARFDHLTAPTAEEFDAASNSTTVSKVDLTDLFANKNNFSSTNTDGIIYTALTFEDDLTNYIASSNLENFTHNNFENRNFVLIRATRDINYSITSNYGYTLSANKNYKLSVSVYTQNIETEVDNVESSILGAGIKLTNFDNYFTAVDTNGAWTTYTFYIKPNSSTTTFLEISLGNEKATCRGDVFVSNFKFETEISDAEFNSVTNSSNIKVLNTVEENNTDDSTPEETPSESKLDKQTLLYLIPSLLFALAIALAIIGVLVRKIKWKKPTRKSKNAYDRNRTVNKQVYTRRATVLRETKLRELNKEMEELTTTRTKYEEDYKHNLSKVREMKIKRASAVEIAKLEREMKKNQKASASIGVTINKLSAEIEYVKSEAYLNAILRKLAQEREEKDTSNQ